LEITKRSKKLVRDRMAHDGDRPTDPFLGMKHNPVEGENDSTKIKFCHHHFVFFVP
jgi:hypothetical protein